MKDNHISYLEFKTKNLKEAKEFYQKTFGWEFKDYGEEYASFSESGLFGGFEVTAEEIVNGALTVLYYSDLLKIKNKITENGGKISKDIFSFPGGSRFHFLDPSGNELGVWSDK